MYVYLSKKIAIPNNINLECLSWNTEQGYIACGGENGLLKVLKLDPAESKDPKPPRGIAASSELTMNQTLEGHGGSVMCVTWNGRFRKLTTSDKQGLIIVWMLHKGMWYEEMINNRNKSLVRDMQWTPDGHRICIVYEDGAVIVGSVDGNRLWGKELETELRLVQWSPDGKTLLFVKGDKDVDVYDYGGNRVMALPLYALDEMHGKSARIVAMDWYDGLEGYIAPDCPSLAVAFENGWLQITTGVVDNNAIKLDTGLLLTQCKWNTNGSVLAIGGTTRSADDKRSTVVQFYTPFGKLIRALKIPGNRLSAISWEGGGLRIAFAVDSFIYFANIRPSYKWCFYEHTLAYSYTRIGRDDQCTLFYDVQSDDKFPKYMRDVFALTACGEYSVIATSSSSQEHNYSLILSNTIGSPLEMKHITLDPRHLVITKFHVIAASLEEVYVWHYRSAGSKLTSVTSESKAVGPMYHLTRHKSRERSFHIDDPHPTADSEFAPTSATRDPIAAICASENQLIIARESGLIHRYSLPHIALETKCTVGCKPHYLALNCNETKLSMIDANGYLSMIDINAIASGQSKTVVPTEFERKDVWAMVWAEDNPDLLAIMEKTKLVVYRGLTPEDPVMTSGYPCRFKDLEVTLVLMDEVMAEPDRPTKDVVTVIETKALKDALDVLNNRGLNEAFEFVQNNQHPRLWKMLGEAALEELNFSIADVAFVNCANYPAIQFVKRLQKLDDKMKQKAEIAVFFERYDEAESIYRDMDRKDLAVELRVRLGDWFRVVALLQSGGGDDKLLTHAWNMIGEHYADRLRWAKAAQYYSQAKNYEALVQCFFNTEDYESLERVSRMLPEGSPLLQDIAMKFQSVGIAEYAVNAYVKTGNVKAALDACVLLNQWDKAVNLAQEHNFPQIEGLLNKYAKQLLEKGKQLQAIELYRKANRSADAAKLLAKLADEIARTKGNPVRAKKLYVLAALEVEVFKKKTLGQTLHEGLSAAQTTAKTLDTLMHHDQTTASSRVLDNVWRGPLAYHFYLLALRQLYMGQVDAAMNTALRLPEYDDILEPKDVYSLVALTSFFNRYFKECSKAFLKLETLPSLSAEQRQLYVDLALQIFAEHTPHNPSIQPPRCPSCDEEVREWHSSCGRCHTQFQVCMATGAAILSNEPIYHCKTCRQTTLEQEIDKVGYCLLCHSPINFI